MPGTPHQGLPDGHSSGQRQEKARAASLSGQPQERLKYFLNYFLSPFRTGLESFFPSLGGKKASKYHLILQVMGFNFMLLKHYKKQEIRNRSVRHFASKVFMKLGVWYTFRRSFSWVVKRLERVST